MAHLGGRSLWLGADTGFGSRESLADYFERAAKELNLGPNVYDENLWNLIAGKETRRLLNTKQLRSFFWQFARSRLDHLQVINFADEFRSID